MEKKQWSRPECAKVRLIQEEAVLKGCKSGGFGPADPTYSCQHTKGGACRGQTS